MPSRAWRIPYKICNGNSGNFMLTSCCGPSQRPRDRVRFLLGILRREKGKHVDHSDSSRGPC